MIEEFGHIGPFISRSHAAHNTSPVFGLGGSLCHVRQVSEGAYRTRVYIDRREVMADGRGSHE